jgi:hypothetical protein
MTGVSAWLYHYVNNFRKYFEMKSGPEIPINQWLMLLSAKQHQAESVRFQAHDSIESFGIAESFSVSCARWYAAALTGGEIHP